MLKRVFAFVWMFVPSVLYANGSGDGWHMMDWHMGYSNVFMWLFFIAIVVLVYMLIRVIGIKSSSDEDTPLDILKKRYAKGEISKEEYERMKQDLES